MALLELRGLSKKFGGLMAVDNLDLVVNKGDIFGLIGPNGSGKTTIFNLITGSLMPSSGNIFFNGHDITALRPDSIVKKGIGRVFQHAALFNESTVLENIIMALYLQAKAGFWRGLFNTPIARNEEKEIKQRAKEMLEFVGLGDLGDELATNIPYGHQRCLSLVIAVATNPTLLLLDEPFTGMNAQEIELMMNITKKLSEQGITIIMIEHHMKSIMALCRKISVMNYGKKIAEGSPQEISQNNQVINAYLGAENYVF
jgi:branched-chain amino acid transport system ATP-binding protein